MFNFLEPVVWRYDLTWEAALDGHCEACSYLNKWVCIEIDLDLYVVLVGVKGVDRFENESTCIVFTEVLDAIWRAPVHLERVCPAAIAICRSGDCW